MKYSYYVAIFMIQSSTMLKTPLITSLILGTATGLYPTQPARSLRSSKPTSLFLDDETMPPLLPDLYRPSSDFYSSLKSFQFQTSNYPHLLDANNAAFLILPNHIDPICDPNSMIALFKNDDFIKYLNQSAALCRNEKPALELNINYISLQELLTDFYQHTPIKAIKQLLYLSQKLSLVSHKNPLDITIKILVKKEYDSFLFAPSFHQHDDPLRYYAVIQLSDNKKAGTLFNYPKNKNRWLTNKNYDKHIYSDNYKDYLSAYWTQAPINKLYVTNFGVPHRSSDLSDLQDNRDINFLNDNNHPKGHSPVISILTKIN